MMGVPNGSGKVPDLDLRFGTFPGETSVHQAHDDILPGSKHKIFRTGFAPKA